MKENPATTPLHVTDATFEKDVLQSKGRIVVDFWAPWCAPCRFLGTALEEIAPEFAGRVQLVKLNVDENPQSAALFGVESIPTMVFFADGQPIGEMTGALPVPALRDLFQRHAEGTLTAK
jgi:thioredoxin 1